ncbi:MAG: hypothetical protein ABSH07_08395 [Candidatus Dormibacteria bacterium]|jgi:hypothetical protein
MSLEHWGLACLWLAGIVIVVAIVLGLVALADPARRHGPRPGTGGSGP